MPERRYREWRAEVPSLELLNRMVSATLPLGLRAGPIEQTFHRDVYFDAEDWTLRRQGVTCRFRVRLDDRRLLTVRSLGRTEGAAVLVMPQTFEADVAELSGEQAIAGTSDPARRLRAMIEPGLLAPRIAFETSRRWRRTHPRLFARAMFELAYDVVTVRRQQLSQSFQEVTLRRLREGRPELDAVAAALQQTYGLRPLLVGKFERAEKLARELDAEGIVRAAQGHREVALIALEEDTIALRDDEAGLRVPVATGSGEEGSRHLLRTSFGSGDGQLRFLGLAPDPGDGSVLEIWLARRVRGQGAPQSGHRWLQLNEVLGQAGSPALREPRTLAALAVATQAGVLQGLTFVAPNITARARASEAIRTTGAEAALSTVGRDASQPAPEQLLNEDLSTLAFNERVLELAEDTNLPLLARVRFLSILNANLDEFFMGRVAEVARHVATGETTRSDDGLTPRGQLAAITLRLGPLLERQARCWTTSCLPALAEHGIRIVGWAELDDSQRAAARQYFASQVFALLTPQAMTLAPGHPFPLIPGLRLCLAAVVRDPRGGALHFACVKLPESLPRFVPLAADLFVPIEDVVRGGLDQLYPARKVEGAYAFRIIRSGEFEVDEAHAASLLQVVEEEVRRRPFGTVVRVEVERGMPQAVRELLVRELQFEESGDISTLGPGDLYEVLSLVDLGALREIAALPRPDLHYAPFQGRAPLAADRSVFDLLKERDVLVHHPYDAFTATVERFFTEAADDPAVVAIKLTLYRAGGRSTIVDALMRAARAGKDVFVFVELKARFDEERNVEWARKLEEAGVNVVHGLVKLKTHSKTALVVRREGETVRRYSHIGTGNYNPATAQLYTDLGLLSADEDLGADLNDLFNELSGSSRPPASPYRRLLVAPTHLLPRFLELIERETRHAAAGRGGHIRVKINGLADNEIILALYRASQAGVDIEICCRGLCRLRPGVPGLSERIRVVSVLGRFLEHARIFHFANAGEPEYYIGSADWRPRNLRRRVEVVTPVRQADCRQQLERILTTELGDPTAWDLGPDGKYVRRRGTPASTEGEV